ncbi:MAG: DNA repair protein RecO [Clostridia bacterium]|nr:DNA repair protein RecO [Clostridia bacterium]
MSVLTLSGIVTRYANYKDNDRMLTILTEHGSIGAAARGCRRPSSQLLPCAELFVYGEFVLFEKQGKYSVNSCDVRESFYPLRQDMDRFYAAAHMLEVANGLAEDGANCAELLKLLYYALTYTAYTDNHPMDMAVVFTAKSLSAMGYTPTITHCASCGEDLRGLARMGFDPAAGGAVCGGCMRQDSIRVSPLSLEALRRMRPLSAEDMQKVALPDAVREELSGALTEYAEHVLERKLRSLSRLKGS